MLIGLRRVQELVSAHKVVRILEVMVGRRGHVGVQFLCLHEALLVPLVQLIYFAVVLRVELLALQVLLVGKRPQFSGTFLVLLPTCGERCEEAWLERAG